MILDLRAEGKSPNGIIEYFSGTTIILDQFSWISLIPVISSGIANETGLHLDIGVNPR